MNIRNKKSKISLNFRRDLLIYMFIVVATFAAYWQLPKNDFISFDDDLYVTHNAHVQGGFTRETIQWAFTTFHAFNWHPLTWLSHMADYRLFGTNASLHHLMSLFLHIVNSILLFMVLDRMTKDKWPAAIVAILFAIHPLHVESVAWVSERKDLLSTFFFLLTMASYVRYVKKQTIKNYIPVFILFMFGLMAKPMLVTLPFVLLLLDIWPIQRVFHKRSIKNDNKKIKEVSIPFLILEKVPLFILSALSSAITFIAQREGGIVRTLQELPLQIRVVNAFVAYIRYIGKMVYPVDLAFYYPYREDIPAGQFLASVFLVICITLFAIKKIRDMPFIFVGWFWYVGMLVPVIGIVQVATQSIADRYTYIPFIGLFILLAWASKIVIERFNRHVKPLAGGLFLMITMLMTLSWAQVRYWENDIQLFSHDVKVTNDNPRSNYHLGLALERTGDIEKAIEHYEEAIRIEPDFLRARNSMGNALSKQGKYEEALPHYIYALTLKKKYADGHFNLGFALMNLGKNDEAIEQYHKAI